MLITDPIRLNEYREEKRIWQGIPSVECTSGGRIFAVFYSGGVTEQLGNYCLLHFSDDGGDTWTRAACAYKDEEHRCYDPCLWIDPTGALWFIWSLMPDHAVYAAVCRDPDADTLAWEEPRYIGEDIMMNKPTVLSDGSWLFPIAVWAPYVAVLPDKVSGRDETAPYVYRTIDSGKTFERLGGPFVENRSFDEHMVYEKSDGTLVMLSRTKYGIAEAESKDGGVTWSDGVPSQHKGPSSRFHIRRLNSGRLLMVNHYDFTGRNNLTAMLSEDDGATWPYRLLLDGRNGVSYPDMGVSPDGSLYIIYDRERGGYKKQFADARAEAREILLSKITEEDIIAGQLVTDGSFLRKIVSKLGDYDGDADALYRK